MSNILRTGMMSLSSKRFDCTGIFRDGTRVYLRIEKEDLILSAKRGMNTPWCKQVKSRNGRTYIYLPTEILVFLAAGAQNFRYELASTENDSYKVSRIQLNKVSQQTHSQKKFIIPVKTHIPKEITLSSESDVSECTNNADNTPESSTVNFITKSQINNMLRVRISGHPLNTLLAKNSNYEIRTVPGTIRLRPVSDKTPNGETLLRTGLKARLILTPRILSDTGFVPNQTVDIYAYGADVYITNADCVPTLDFEPIDSRLHENIGPLKRFPTYLQANGTVNCGELWKKVTKLKIAANASGICLLPCHGESSELLTTNTSANGRIAVPKTALNLTNFMPMQDIDVLVFDDYACIVAPGAIARKEDFLLPDGSVNCLKRNTIAYSSLSKGATKNLTPDITVYEPDDKVDGYLLKCINTVGRAFSCNGIFETGTQLYYHMEDSSLIIKTAMHDKAVWTNTVTTHGKSELAKKKAMLTIPSEAIPYIKNFLTKEKKVNCKMKLDT